MTELVVSVNIDEHRSPNLVTVDAIKVPHQSAAATAAATTTTRPLPALSPSARTPTRTAAAPSEIQAVAVPRSVSNQNQQLRRHERQAQEEEVRKLQDRRKREVERLERIRQRDDIHDSVQKFERTLAKNEAFGFSCRNLVHEMPYQKAQQKKFLQTERRRQRMMDNNNIDGVNIPDEEPNSDRICDDYGDDENDCVRDEDGHLFLPSEAAFNGEASLKMEELQRLHDNRKQQTSHGVTVPKSGRRVLRRTVTDESGESTLSPIKDPNNHNNGGLDNHDVEQEDSLVDLDKPVPDEILCNAPTCLDDSEISLNSQIFVTSEKQGSRWESHAYNPRVQQQHVDDYAPPVQFKTPTPATMKQPDEGSRWAVHPRVVYAAPKTKKVVKNIDRFRSPLEMNVPVEEIENRWAASTTRKKKVFPKNSSRWAAQPKHSSTAGGEGMPGERRSAGITKAQFPHNKPRRQKTNEVAEGNGTAAAPSPKKPMRKNSNPAKSAPAPKLPERKLTSEGEDFPLKHKKHSTLHHVAESDTPPSDRQPRRGRRRRSISGDSFGPAEAMAMAKSMPTVERDLDGHVNQDTISMSHNTSTGKECQDDQMIKSSRLSGIARVPRNSRVGRNKSLGEVKRIHAAVRIQSMIRRYLQQYHFKITLQEKRKDKLKKEMTQEILAIQDEIEARKQSLHEEMKRNHVIGLGGDVGTADTANEESTEDAATMLRREIADMESINEKLQKQCDRLRSTNQRMVGGNKTRENAVKDVSARLKKLQLIQSKLDRVQKEFEKERVTVQEKLQNVEYSLERELALGDKAKACTQEIKSLLRSKGEAQLADELEAVI